MADLDPHTFTAEDRRALTVLGVDMSYMKEAVDDIRSTVSEKGSIQTRLAVNEREIETLKQFRWWVTGVAAGAGAVAGVIWDLVKPK